MGCGASIVDENGFKLVKVAPVTVFDATVLELEQQRSECAAAAKLVPGADGNITPGKVVAGFDGCIDSIIAVVDQRTSREQYSTIPTLSAFGSRIAAAAGESTNAELITKVQKMGGNGPIMCNAMLGYGTELTYIGSLGQDQPDAVYAPLVSRTKEVITLGPPALTDALEFQDGKLMLGKVQPFEAITYEAIVAAVGLERLTKLYSGCDAIVSVNWTMLMNLTSIWQGLLREVLPKVAEKGKRPFFFVDIADPKKRTREDLKGCVDTLAAINQYCNVILSLNCSETRQCLGVVGETWEGGTEDCEAARLNAAKLQKKTGIYMIQVHLKGSAAGATATESVGIPGYYTSQPVMLTGGGDHFNGGFLSALLSGCSLSDALRIGGATSGNYVRGVSSRGEVTVGRSPVADDTVQFLKYLPDIDPVPSTL